MRIGTCVRDACDGRSNRIHDTEYKGALFLRAFDGYERIGRFATLGDRKDDITGSNYWVAVTEFRGIFYFHRDAAKGFYHVFRDKAGMPARATGYDDDSFRLRKNG